jgi:hypothetical protein
MNPCDVGLDQRMNIVERRDPVYAAEPEPSKRKAVGQNYLRTEIPSEICELQELR